jgi:hypothetical protein
MKTLLITATALSLSGAAHAYQTAGAHNHAQHTTPPTSHQSSTPPLGTATQERAAKDQQQMHRQHSGEVPHQHQTQALGQTPQTAQPGVYQSTPPLGTATQERAWLDARQQMMMGWTADQRRLAEEHWRSYPAHWTQQQRTAYQQMMGHSPAHWTADQRAMYEEHMRTFPANWTAEQRSWYQQQMAGMQRPWTHQMQHGQMHGQMHGQGSAYWNPDQWAGMGGPYEEVYGDGRVDLTPRPAQTSYPPCSPGPGDDRCIQLYERGVTGRR